MAITTEIPTPSERLAQGWSEWDLNGVTFLTALKNFCNGHTHTGSPDGTAIPAGAYAAGSIDADDLATAVKKQTHEYVYGAAANTFTYPIFRAPNAGVVNTIYMVPAANIVQATDNNFTLKMLKYSAAGATNQGTLCTLAATAATGTYAALVPQSFGTITGGTLTAGQVIALNKATAGSGLDMGVGCLFIIEFTPTA